MLRAYTRAIQVTHYATGEVVTVTDQRLSIPSWPRIRQACIRVLSARLFAMQRGEYPPNKSIVRTYHSSPFGTWTKDHRTGDIQNDIFLGDRITTKR